MPEPVAATATYIGVCWICDRTVSLETCKIDEHGNAMHEECYLACIRANGACHSGLVIFGTNPT